MTESIELLNFVLALGGIVLLMCTAYLVYDLKTEKSLSPLLKKHGLTVAFLITFFGSVLTLVYSEVFGFIPCGLCWLQRVFLYPQAIILAGALWIKDKTVAFYGLLLSSVGLVIALYQHYLQMGGTDLVGCPTAGVGADCAKRIMFEFGFITFPLLSAITFIFLIVLYLYIIKIDKK